MEPLLLLLLINMNLRKDFYVVVTLVLLATVLTIAFNLSFLVSTMLFFAVPAAYLFIKKPRPLNRILLASVFFWVGIDV